MKCPQCGCEHLVYTEHNPTNVLPWFNIVFLIAAIAVGRLSISMTDTMFTYFLVIIVLDIIFNVVCLFVRPKSRTKATCPECGYYILN